MPELASHTIHLRVRYPEVDAMGYLHHSRHLQYFELGRVELLRARGTSYADLEAAGVFFVVVKAAVQYRQPARYDDELTLTTTITRATTVRYDHTYELERGDDVLATGQTTIACVNREGQVIPIPDQL
jgi:acyl-CoA thioester hydrolase